MTKKILVTGAGGFIAGHLVRRLVDEGHEVWGVDVKPREEWWQIHPDAHSLFELDCKLLTTYAVQEADEIYHLAEDMGGIGFITSHLVDCASSIVNTVELLKKTRSGQRVLFTSSACVYPAERQNDANVTALKESDAIPAQPEAGYGWEKLYAEQLCLYHGYERGVETRIARLHNVFGAHGSWTGGREKAPAALSRKVAEALYTGRDFIDLWGDGQATRSFMYVDDCVSGLLAIARGTYVGPVNLGTSELVTVKTLAQLVMDVAGVPDLGIKYVPGPQGVRGRNSDNTLFRQLFGWEPTTPLRAGLAKTYPWVEDQARASLEAEAKRA